MIETIRNRLSAHLITIGVCLAPRYMRPIVAAVMQSLTGISKEIQEGRTGGIIYTGWSVDEKGRELAAAQQIAVGFTAAQVRRVFEKERANGEAG